MSGRNTVTIVVCRYDTDIVFSRFESYWDIVHKDELDSFLASVPICCSCGNRVRRDGDNYLRILGQNLLYIGDLLLGSEASISDRDYLDAHFVKLRFEAGNLRLRPVIS